MGYCRNRTPRFAMSTDRDDDRWGNDRDDRDDRGYRDRDDRRDFEEARRKVKGPAIALMVTALLAFLSLGLGMFQYFVTMPAQFEEQRRKIDDDPKMTEPMKKDMHAFIDTYEQAVKVAIPVDWPIVGITSILIFVGALKMKNLSSRGWGRAAAILAMIPCLSGCCLLGIPIGIWALMALSNEDVKRGFAFASSATNRDDDLR